MGITLRNTKGTFLSHNELDTNFSELYHSSSVNNHVITLFSDGSGSSFPTISHSLTVNTGSTLLLYSEAGTQATITGSLVVTGDITAEQFHTEIQSASIIYRSGSTKFSDSQDDTHSFTGSLELSGSTTIGGSIANAHQITGSIGITGSADMVGAIDLDGGITVNGYATLSHTGSNAATVTNGYVILSEVSQSLNFADDTAAASGGIPLGGLYRNGNFIQIRVS